MPHLSRSRLLALSLAFTAAAGCTDDDIGPRVPAPPRGVVVLNGFGEPGITLLGDTGTASTHVEFEPFDGASFALDGDTVLATSSKWAGGLLYVADARTGDFASIQLPVNSNPANARFVEQPGLGRVAAVALRDSNAVALVKVAGDGAGSYTRVRDAGQCPTDVFRAAAALYVVASNERCASDYLSLGAAYVVRIPDSGPTQRETIPLGTPARGAGSAIVLGDTAYVFTIGLTSFGGNVPAPPAVSRFDLRTRQIINSLPITGAVIGNVMRLGADGRLYVAAYTTSDFAQQRVFALDPRTLEFRGEREAGKDYLRLQKSGGGGAPNCAAATADARGNVYCVETTTTGASTLLVFAPNGTQLRSAPAGLGGIDIALRM